MWEILLCECEWDEESVITENCLNELHFILRRFLCFRWIYAWCCEYFLGLDNRNDDDDIKGNLLNDTFFWHKMLKWCIKIEKLKLLIEEIYWHMKWIKKYNVLMNLIQLSAGIASLLDTLWVVNFIFEEQLGMINFLGNF